MRSTRRKLVAGTAASAAMAWLGLPIAACAQAPRLFRPEEFGARGDGVTNDTVALGRLAGAVNAAGGGTVELMRGATYLVGMQESGGQYYLTPRPLLAFESCRDKVIVRGNGARIRCASGLRYGTFDRQHGRALRGQGRVGEIATPYLCMIGAERCRGGVEIRDIELDGNIQNLVIGGGYDAIGRQIGMSGIVLKDNDCPELVENVSSHHHGLDGMVIDGVGSSESAHPTGGRIVKYHGRNNGRQALSLVGGVGYQFSGCQFNHTGRDTGPLDYSPPGAGVDIEAEGNKKIRDIGFTSCEFMGNVGGQMVASVGDSKRVTFNRCRFIGDVGWSAWPNKPYFRFNGCTFVGAIVNLYPGDRDPASAAQFTDCTFTNDPAASPGGRAFGPAGVLVSGGQSENNVFTRCTFIHGLPGTTSNGSLDQMRFIDCTFRAKAGVVQFYGHFIGNTRFIEEGGTFLGLPGGGVGLNHTGESETDFTVVRRGVAVRHRATRPS